MPTGHKESVKTADCCATTSVKACYSTNNVIKETSGHLFPLKGGL